MQAILLRDGPTCVWCGRTFTTLLTPTTEHLVPRVKGGPSRLSNEVAACRRCNADRGHLGPAAWLEECQRRGWPVDAGRVERVLCSLQDDIATSGGNRRARGYLVHQLRRLGAR